jgi:centrosomal protein CEP120
LEAVPLVIELWHKDEFSKDVPLGMATLHLSQVLKQKPRTMESSSSPKLSPLNNPNKKYPFTQEPIPCQVYSLDTFYLISASGHDNLNYKKVADVRVVLALEDFGAIEEEFQTKDENPLMALNETFTREGDEQITKTNQKVKLQQQSTVEKSTPLSHLKNEPSLLSLHDTPEYKVALELELYKQHEEKKFKLVLQQKEEELLSQLVNEWKKREKEREALLKQKISDLNSLETQFKELLKDLEIREKKLDAGEDHLNKRKQDLEREFDRRIDEARDATRRLQEEFKHKIELEKLKTSEVESQKLRISKERDDLQQRYRHLESDISEFKQKLGNTTEAQLRAEINSLLTQKAELEKQVSTLLISKKHYKTEWIKTLATLSQFKKQIVAEQEANQLKEKRDLQRLKIQFMAKEELSLVNNERQTMQSLLKEIESLKRSPLSPNNNNNNNNTNINLESSNKNQENKDPHLQAEISRLSRERDHLLATGVYSLDDRVIQDLNFKISQF